MIASHVHDALSQVNRLQELIAAKKQFKGYSWIARLFNAVMAITCACILSFDGIASTPGSVLIGWGILLAVTVAVNYSFVLFWFLFDREVKKDFSKALPVLYAFPTLFAGGVISIAMIVNQEYRYLYGVWMCLFGLTHLSYRFSLPRINYAVGFFYLACGTFFLIVYPVPFTNPWPMGIVFFIGELFGSLAFYQIRLGKKTQSRKVC